MGCAARARFGAGCLIAMPRRVLIVAAEFPPVKGIGRLRPLKFCQHLNHLGWQTAVLSPAEGDIEPVDLQTLDEIPQATKMYRAAIPKPKDKVIRAVKALLGRNQFGQATVNQDRTSTATTQPASRTSGFSLGQLMGNLDAFARKNLLIPDDIVLWTRPAVREGIRAVREFQPDVILATAPHFTNLLVGSRLSRATGVPWVADYRDLWTGDVLRAWVPKWRQGLELLIERRILATASAAITVSGPKSDVVRGRVSQPDKCPVVTLTNGYDPEEFEGIVAEQGNQGLFRIVYAGRLFKNRRGYELIEAAGQLLQEKPALRQHLAIEYYGGVAPEIAARMQALIEQYKLAQVVRFHPDVSYLRSKALQKGADALLLIVDSGETSSGVIPGKLFEYIAAHRPILCVAAPGATTDILVAGRLGEVVSPGDVQNLKTALTTLLDRANEGFNPDTAYLAQFERGKVVERLAQLLDDVIGSAHRGGAR